LRLRYGGIDNHQSVGLGHLRGNFCQVLGARHADRDGKANFCPNTAEISIRKGHTYRIVVSDLVRGAAINVLNDFTPLVERISIDEAFADADCAPADCARRFERNHGLVGR
jgi:hypothetical protein